MGETNEAKVVCSESNAFVEASSTDGDGVRNCPACSAVVLTHEVPDFPRQRTIEAHAPKAPVPTDELAARRDRDADARLLAGVLLLADMTRDLDLIGQVAWARAARMAGVGFPNEQTRDRARALVAEAVAA